MSAKNEEEAEVLSIEDRQVRVTHPDKLYFSRQMKLSKLALVRYYLSVAPGALAGIRDRPIVLKRFVNGAEGEAFYQKRAPSDRPSWMRTVTLAFPSGRTAEELVVDDAAGLAWIVNLGCIELHPHPVRSENLDHPDELRVDLDPGPGVSWADVRRVALEVKALLDEVGLKGWAKTSGSRGMHVNVRIEPRWSFTEVRRAALACRVQSSGAYPLSRVRSGGRKNGTGSSSITTRMQRIEPRPRPILYVRCRMLGYPRRFVGKRCRTASQLTLLCLQCLNVSQRSAILMPTWTTRLVRSRACLTSRQRMKPKGLAMPLGRHTFAKWKEKRLASRPHEPNHPRSKQPRKSLERKCRFLLLQTLLTKTPR